MQQTLSENQQSWTSSWSPWQQLPGHTTNEEPGSMGHAVSDTDTRELSQLAISPSTQPKQLLSAGDDDCAHCGGFTSSHATPFPGSQTSVGKLNQSEFAPSGSQEQVPDHVVIEKQCAQEAYLRQESRDSCMSDNGQDVCCSDTSSTSIKGDKDFTRYPVQETPDASIDTLHSADSGRSGYTGNVQGSVGYLSGGGSVGYSSTTSSFDSWGPPLASNIHQPSINWENDPRFTIPSNEYPPQFREGQYDCVLIYSSEKRDAKMASNFKDIVSKTIVLEDGGPPKVCLLDSNNMSHGKQSCFSDAQEAIKRSTYMFFILTKDFVDDDFAETHRDECLMSSIRDPKKRWCVVPLHTKNGKDLDFKYPYGMNALKGINIATMLPGQKLEDVDPNNISRDLVDKHFLANTKRLLDLRSNLRRERELEQERELQRWKQEEQQKHMLTIMQHEHRTRVTRRKHAQERANMKRALSIDTERVDKRLGEMSLPNMNTADRQELTRQHSMPLSLTDSGKMKETLHMMLGMGMTLSDAVSLLRQQQLQAGRVPDSQSPPTYKIYNYGNLQVGEQNKQDIRKDQQDQYDRGNEDEGIVYDVEEEPSLHTDAGPQDDVSGTRSIQMPSLVTSPTESGIGWPQSQHTATMVEQEHSPGTANDTVSVSQDNGMTQTLYTLGTVTTLPVIHRAQSQVAVVRPQYPKEPQSRQADPSQTSLKVPHRVPRSSDTDHVHGRHHGSPASTARQHSNTTTQTQALNSNTYLSQTASTFADLNLQSTTPSAQIQHNTVHPQGYPTTLRPTHAQNPHPTTSLYLSNTTLTGHSQSEGHSNESDVDSSPSLDFRSDLLDLHGRVEG